MNTNNRPERAPVENAEGSADIAFSYDDMVSCIGLIKDYSSAVDSLGLSAAIGELQDALIDFIKQTDDEKLRDYCNGHFGAIFRGLTKCGFTSVGLNEDKIKKISLGLKPMMKSDGAIDVQALLAAMLQVPAYCTAGWGGFSKIPAWLMDDYLPYLFYNPQVFVFKNEAELYFEHLQSCGQLVLKEISAFPDSSLTIKIVEYFASNVSCIPLYFTRANTRRFMETRATILEFMLQKKGASIDFALPKTPRNRARIKVGILSAHFGAQTETHVTLPSLQLDRSKFEVSLFCVHQNPGPVEDYSRSFADTFSVLPKDLHQQVKFIRAAALDVIIIGTNITAVTNQIGLIALHRLAPLQLVNYCSPVSTGMRHIDGYITGSFNDFPGIQDHFSEKLHFCEGAPGCLDYTVEKMASGEVFTREKLGLDADSIVYINAAACYKILPEMQEVWAKVLKEVPNSKLLLLPFNPNWSNSFPVKQFERSLTEIFARHGLGRDRFILGGALPSRADVKGLEKIADVYLDTFPFSGSISVIDPLEIGLPVVVSDGDTHRARMAAALVRALDLPELIAPTEAEYIQLAVKLGVDGEYRARLSGKILTAMAQKPKFINAKVYAQDLGGLLESLSHEPPALSSSTSR